MSGFKTLRLDAVDTLRDDDTGADWITLRHRLGVTAFGLNAYRAPEAGVQVIVDHDESRLAAIRRSTSCSAARRRSPSAPRRSTRRPAPWSSSRTRRCRASGIAKEPGTTVLAIGAQPGRIFTPSSWESELLEGSAS